MLAEKAESVKLWKEMIDIAYNLDDRLYDVKLADSDTSVKGIYHYDNRIRILLI